MKNSVNTNKSIVQSNKGATWTEIIKGKAVKISNTTYESIDQKVTLLKRDMTSVLTKKDETIIALNSGDKSPTECQNQMNINNNLLSYGPTCSNSFDICEDVGGRDIVNLYSENKLNEGGRKGMIGDLPKSLKSDYVLEY